MMETIPEVDAPTKEQAPTDVLYLLRNGHCDQPQKTRTPVLKLAKAGINMQVRVVPDQSALPTYLEKFRPRMLLMGMLCIKQSVVEELAKQFPDTKFVAVNHSGLSHMLTAEGLLQKHLAFVDLSKRQSNFFLASPDRRQVEVYAHEKVIWLPNCCCELRPAPPQRPVPAVMTVSLICRYDLIKNLGCSLAGLAIANRIRPMKLLLGVGGPTARVQPLIDLATSLNLETESVGTLPWKEYVENLNRVDIGMQVSYSETFNFVAWEHLARAIPVVSGSAVSFVPEEFRADPTSPKDIAEKLCAIARRIERGAGLRSQCRVIAKEVGDRNNREFVRTIQHILCHA